MSFPALEALRYADVAAILPQDRKAVIEGKTNQAKELIRELGIRSKETVSHWSIAIAIGAILCLVGIFLTLAAHQVLPHGINAISDLGVCGQVISYSGMVLGVIIGVVGELKWYLKKQNAAVEPNQPDASDTHYLAEAAEVNAYFPHRLKKNELFALDDPSKEEVTIYYREQDSEGGGSSPGTPKKFEYKNSTIQQAFLSWSDQNKDLIKDKAFINLDELRQRTESFEQKKAKPTE